MERLKTMIKRILHPGTTWMASCILTSTAMLIFTFNTDRNQTAFGYFAYTFSAYSMTIFVVDIPAITEKIGAFIDKTKFFNRVMALIHRNKYSRRFLSDLSFRTRVSLHISLSVSLLYAAFKLIASIHYASFWYGADAIYYTVLSVVQFLLLRHVSREESDIENEYRQYRFCGYLLFVLNAASTGVVYQIINQDRSYRYPGHLIYAVAAYAFVCLIFAIINVVKYRKLNRPILSAVKAFCLAKALVAIFALQTALLSSFGSNESESFKMLMKSLTGGGVCIVIFAMAVFMVVKANKCMKKAGINNTETIR